MLAGTSVEAFEGDRAVERVRTSDGRRARVRLRGRRESGCSPAPELAADAGLMIDNGIRVDEYLHSAAPGVFAAGDVANAHHRFYGEPVRVEHWANALHQGPVAARNMLGRSRGLRPPAVLLLRSVRHRHGVRRPRPDLGSRRLPRRSRHPRVHRVLDGRRSRRGRHELQRLGRHRRHPAAHRPARRGRRPAARRSGACRSRRSSPSTTELGMNRLQALHDAGVSIWLDTPLARAARERRVRAADRRLRGDRRDVEPHDLRRRHHRLRPLRRPAPRRRRLGRPRAARAVLRARARRRRPRRRPAARRLRGQRRARRLRVLRVHARPRRRPRGHDRAGARPLEPPRPAQRDDQGPGHRRRGPGDRRAHRARRERQRHPAVLRRALRTGHRRLRPRPRATRGRRRARRLHRLGRLVLRVARRRQGRRAAARRLGAARAGGDRQRERAYGRYRARFADERWRRCARPARIPSDRCGPAPVPRTRRTPTSSTSRS